MVECARVVEIPSKGKVVVEVTRHEACHTCAARGACNPGGGKVGRTTASCSLDVSVGDTVEIEISDSAVRVAILWAYVVPALLMLAGLFCAWLVAPMIPMIGAQRDILAGAGALVGAGVGVGVMWLVNRRISRPGTKAHERFHVSVVRVMEPG